MKWLYSQGINQPSLVLKNIKVEHLSNPSWIFSKFKTEAQMTKSKIQNAVKWSHPPIEIELKMLEVEYLSN